MAVLTIYNHGTGGWSGKEEAACREIVNILGNNDPSQRGTGKIITEGVGGKGDPHLQMVSSIRSHNPLSAQYPGNNAANSATKMYANPLHFQGQAAVQEMEKHSVEVSQNGKSNDAARWGLKMGGTGVDLNVYRVVKQIEALYYSRRTPTTINMIGWSRGAVTCIRIAYALWQKQNALSRIPINIFAVDPVAGSGHNKEVDAITLTPNVKNYVATLAMDERRGGYKPIDDTRLVVKSAQTSVVVLPVKGIHRDTAKGDNASGLITFNLAVRFLSKHGTQFPNWITKLYVKTNPQIWNLYSQLRSGPKGGGVKKGQKFSLEGGVSDRAVLGTLANYSIDGFFLNAHAHIVFKQTYPVLHDAYFGTGRSQRNSAEWQKKWGPRIAGQLVGLPKHTRTALDKLEPVGSGLHAQASLAQSLARTAVINKNSLTG